MILGVSRGFTFGFLMILIVFCGSSYGFLVKF